MHLVIRLQVFLRKFSPYTLSCYSFYVGLINFTSVVHFSLELRYFACSSKVSFCSNRFNEIFVVVVVIGFYIISLKTSHVMRM